MKEKKKRISVTIFLKWLNCVQLFWLDKKFAFIIKWVEMKQTHSKKVLMVL